MFKRFTKPSESREYSFEVTRSNGHDFSTVALKDKKALGMYIDILMQDSDLIPAGADKVLVNLKETENTLFCEVKPFFSKN